MSPVSAGLQSLEMEKCIRIPFFAFSGCRINLWLTMKSKNRVRSTGLPQSGRRGNPFLTLDAKRSQQTGCGVVEAQNPSQYTAENYSLLTKLGGGTLLVHIGVINHSFTDSLASYPLLTLIVSLIRTIDFC